MNLLHGLQYGYLLWYGLFHGLEGNICCGTWSSSSPFFSALGDAFAISKIFCSLPLSLCGILPFLIHLLLEALSSWLMGSAVSCVRTPFWSYLKLAVTLKYLLQLGMIGKYRKKQHRTYQHTAKNMYVQLQYQNVVVSIFSVANHFAKSTHVAKVTYIEKDY